MSQSRLKTTIQLLTSLAVFNACGPSFYDIELNCIPGSNTVCSSTSQGGQINWLNSRLEPGAEYVIAILSRQSTDDLNALTHELTIDSTQPSAPRPENEQIAINRVLQNQGTFLYNIESQYTDTISAPRFNFDSSFYIPNPLDYMSRRDDQLFPIWVPKTNGERRTGDRHSAQKKFNLPSVFDLMVSDNVYQTDAFSAQMSVFNSCASTVIPQTISMLGSPLNLDGKSEINVVVTNFQSGSDRQPLGLFFPVDRFRTYRGQELIDSNYGEVVYLSPQPNAFKACSTAAHELQHMINFDHKVLHQIPESERSDLASQERRGLRSEELGLDEAYSHLVELLTDQISTSNGHIYNFLTNAHRSSFALEIPTGDVTMTSRTRGANTLLLMYALNRVGGTLNREDPITQQFLRTLISSPDRGIGNIAKYLNTTEDALIQDFFTQLVRSLYSTSAAQDFLPAVITQQISPFESRSKGVKFVDRSNSINDVQYRPPYIHPYQVPIESIKRIESTTVAAQSMHFYRFKANGPLPSDSSIRVSTRGRPFSLFIVKP